MSNNYEILEQEEQFNQVLEKGMFYADSFVNKNYLINLDRYPVVELEDDRKSDDYIRLYRIERIVFDVDENANDKLISVYSALYNIQASCILVLKSTGMSLEFYIGIRSEENASAAEAILRKSFGGNFPGSVMHTVQKTEIGNVLSGITEQTRFGSRQNVSSVSIVPSARDEDKNQFVQGIENFIDTMKGEKYTAVFIAEPVNKENLERKKQGLLNLQSSLSPFKSTQLSYGTNQSEAVAKGMSKSFSKAVNESLTDTNSEFESKTRSRQYGANLGLHFGMVGLGGNMGRSKAYTSGNSWAHAVTSGSTDTTGTTEPDTETRTTGDSRTITVTNENKAVIYISDKIEQHLNRIKKCESFGMWDVCCYFVSENIQTSVVTASSFKALMAGYDSGIENSYVNIWDTKNRERTPMVLENLRYCVNPYFVVPENLDVFATDEQYVSACSLISGNELPFIMAMPRKSVQGVTVLDIAEFGRNVLYSENPPKGKSIRFGQVFHMGMTEQARVNLDLQSFHSHCFITGSTGSGKSNTTYRILDEMIENKIPFLVVEPAKGEYKRYYGSLPGIHVFCTNPKYFSMLKINPFKFHPDIHVLEHLDRLIEIFNACWPLYAAMPAILKESFERAYVRCGWDLNTSIYIPTDRSKYPTFSDVLETLPEIINSSEYSSDSKGDYTGALVTRVRSLTNGILGRVMCNSDDIDDEELFDENCIVDLSRISSLETKSLIMGILILKLNEHRMCCSEENQPLRHITVLEEAHNILKRTSGSGGAESADVQGKSVEMISASIAEMRTYGEGFIIVDQSPTAVDVSAIKNTNTKIIMRLPDYDDCLISGRAIGLSDSQIHEISRFPMGVAAVYQNNWVEAVLTKIDKSEEKYHSSDEITKEYVTAEVKGRLATCFMIQYEMEIIADDGVDLEELQEVISSSNLTGRKKREMNENAAAVRLFFESNPVTRKNFTEQLYKMMGCGGLFDVLRIEFSQSYEGKGKLEKANIAKKDRVAITRWYRDLYRHIDEYVYISDESMKKKLIHYLIYWKRFEEKASNKYHLIYLALFS